MARADHIYVKRLGYTHHGIDTGNGTVIHYTGEVGQKANACIRRTPLDQFTKESEIHVHLYGECDPPDVVIERAESRMNEATYSLLFNNCEHFATWCKTGRHESEQVKNTASVGGGTVGGGAAVAAGLGTVSATGAVAGLSASGVMSGLATVGSVVGGGAVAGITVVGAAPAAISTFAMRAVLRDDPILHETEREARSVGRTATAVGAAVGSVSTVGAVAASGTVAGLSAAGISSGLAAIGGTVGGGMVAGVAITAAAPAVIATAVGYGSYRLYRWLRGR